MRTLKPFKYVTNLSTDQWTELDLKVERQEFKPTNFVDLINDPFYNDELIEHMCEVNDNVVIFMVEPEYAEKLVLFFDRWGSKVIEYGDATEELLRGDLVIEKYEPKCKRLLEEYMVNNFSVNDVLDVLHEKQNEPTPLQRLILETKKAA